MRIKKTLPHGRGSVLSPGRTGVLAVRSVLSRDRKGAQNLSAPRYDGQVAAQVFDSRRDDLRVGFVRLALILSLLSATAFAATPGKPRVSAALVADMAQKLDMQVSRMMPDDPVMPVGLTQGAYIPGFGVVFMGSVNLAPMAGITPFHQSISKEEIARVHHKKVDRLPKLKDLMLDVLVNFATTMDPVPPEERITIAVTLFYFTGEDTGGLPSQVVMRATRKTLLDGRGNKVQLASAVQVDEF